MKNIKVTILKLLRRVLSLTSIKTSLPKTMTGVSKLVELYLTITSSLQVICLRVKKTKSNKQTFVKVLSPSNWGEIAASETVAECIFMIKLIGHSFLLEAA